MDKACRQFATTATPTDKAVGTKGLTKYSSNAKAINDNTKNSKTKKPSISLILGDCLKMLKTIRSKSIHAIISDPPYSTTQCNWDQEIDLAALWEEFHRVAKDDAPIVMFSAQPFTSKLVMSNPNGFRYSWYWEKEKGTNFFTANHQPLRVIEEICVFSKSAGSTYKPQMMKLDKPYRHTMPIKHSAITGKGNISEAQNENRQYKTYTHSHPKNILTFPRDRKNLIPTQKPVALLEYIIKTYTDRGNIVLDATMGSGSCGVACQNLGRHFIGIEKKKSHFMIATARLNC